MVQTTRIFHLIIRIASILMLAGIFLVPVPPTEQAAAYNEKPLARLVDLIRLENKVSPLHPIGNFERNIDPSLHAANMEYLKNNRRLLEKISADLGEQDLQWHLKSLTSRLLYVPENRPEYIALYEAYCLDVIRDILDQTQLQNPYSGIITLSDKPPRLQSSDGLCAYIVHNLASEVHAKYEFRNTSKKAVAIELSGQYLSGEVGSYSSYLSFNEDGEVFFTRDRFTIWQNSAQNPYTALMAPVEETFHIALRKNTETAIKTVIENKKPRSIREAKKVVDEWISVEEALVGGLVYSLLPPILEKKVGMHSQAFISKDIETKSDFTRYRHLKQGIDLVKRMGYKAAIRLYQDDPIAFRSLL